MDEIDRVCNKNYIPTDEDLLLVRYRTLGMTEKLFRMGPKPDIFKFVDVGGERNGTIVTVFTFTYLYTLLLRVTFAVFVCGLIYLTNIWILRETKMEDIF